MTRTTLGLDLLKRRLLSRRDCPFRNVIVTWDTTPQALREWRESRSVEYENAANTNFETPIPAASWIELSEVMEGAVSRTATPESEVPSMSFHVDLKTQKEGIGQGAIPETSHDPWRDHSRTNRETLAVTGTDEIENAAGALQASLFREDSRNRWVPTTRCAKVVAILRPENARATAKSAAILPRKQTKVLSSI